MTPSPLSSDLRLALTFALLLGAPLAIAGLALLNTGLGRSRSAAQSLLGSVLLAAIAVLAFAILGAGFAGSSSQASIAVGGHSWGWLGTGPFLLARLSTLRPGLQLASLAQMVGVALAVLIPWGAGADRLRLSAGCLLAALLGAFAFPLAAHWTWGGGWLAQLGPGFSLGSGFLDPAGAGTVHFLGGLGALSVIWVTGPRKGKFPKEGLATAMPAHNAVYVLFGCAVSLAGWLAWNSAAALLFVPAAPASNEISTLVVTAINTLLAASAAVLATFIVTRIRFGKPDASLCANGWVAGLVTSSGCAAVVSPAAALFAGLVAGVFTPLLVEVLELALSIDDPTAAVTVHGAGGLWGLLCAGFFAPRAGQLPAQLIGIAALLGVFLPLFYLLFSGLNRILPFRADADGERLGMDVHELGGGAFPEFVIHRDESYR